MVNALIVIQLSLLWNNNLSMFFGSSNIYIIYIYIYIDIHEFMYLEFHFFLFLINNIFPVVLNHLLCLICVQMMKITLHFQ